MEVKCRIRISDTLRIRGKSWRSEAKREGGDKRVDTRMQSSIAGTAGGGT